MSESFEIIGEADVGSAAVLRVVGRLDAKSAPQLTRSCAAIRAAGRDLILNLSGVMFIASSGLGALLTLTEEFQQANRRLRLASPSQAVLSVVHLLNLDQFLSIDASEEEAARALGS
jgi:anti-anti-sigma factor